MTTVLLLAGWLVVILGSYRLAVWLLQRTGQL